MEQYPLNQDGFWDIRDLSNYLKVKIKTLYALVPEIPHYRVGKLIRFRKQEIDSWMEDRRGTVFSKDLKSELVTKRIRNSNADIDKLIRNAIDQSKQNIYNAPHGKSDRIEGPTKEMNHGSV